MDQDIEVAIERSFLGRLPRDVADRLIEGQPLMELPAGATIYREGDPPRAFLVVSGLVRIFMTSPDGRQVTIRYGRPTDVVGTALVAFQPVAVHAQTLAPTTALGVDVRGLDEAARDDAKVAYALVEELGRRLDDAIQLLAIHAFGSVKQRVASQLLDVASTQRPAERRLAARLSTQELADAVGSVREVVARTLRDFRAEGLVATSADEIEILDATRLFEESWGALTL